jgi:lipopolysaccharide biosynthesis glycosyltransferase
MCNSYIAQFGIPIRIVRLAMTFGAGVPLSDNRVYMQFINAGRTGNDIVLHTDGISVVSVTYLADAVRAIFNVLFSNTETVLNVSALSLSIWDMADTIASQYGVKVRIDLPDDATVKGYAPQSVLKLNADRLHSLGWQPHYNNIADICKRLADYVLVIPRKKQHINIVTKSSTAYLPYCQTMMVSCLENNKDFVLDFYIFTMDLSVDDKQSLNELVAKYDASVTVIEFDPEPVFIFEPLRRAKGKYGGQLTYSWLFSHSYLPESCNRALLLGSDTLCIGDLSEFYFTDFKDTYGVLCYGGIELIDRPEQIPPKLPASNKYTSADFYLLNLDKMRADNIVAQTYLDKYEQYCAENHVQRKMTFDETYLKVLLEQAVVLPAKKYCAQVLQFADTNDEFDENCAVIHYVHMQKPWTIDIGISLTAFDDYQKRLWSKGRIFYMLYRRLGVLSSGNDGKWRWIYGSIVDFAYKSATLWWKYAAMTSQYEKLCEDLTVANNQCEFALPSIVREIELVKERFYRNNLLSDKEILHFHDSNLIFRHDYNRIATLTRDGVVYFYPFVRCKQFCRVSLVSNLRNGVSYKLVVYMKIKSTNARVNVGVCRESQHSELQKLLTCSPLSYIENPTLTAFETTFTANSDNYDSLFFDPRNVFDTGSYIAISSILLTKLAN